MGSREVMRCRAKRWGGPREVLGCPGGGLENVIFFSSRSEFVNIRGARERLVFSVLGGFVKRSVVVALCYFLLCSEDCFWETMR